MNVIRKFYGTGFGSLHTSQKNEPAPAPGPPGPPFLLTSADSGLWVNPISGKIELDGSGGLNPLLQGTLIEQGGFTFEILNGGNGQFLLDPTTLVSDFGDIDNATSGLKLRIDNASTIIRLGDISGVGNRTFLRLIDNQQTFEFLSGALNQYLSLDVVNGLYQIGDISGSSTGTTLILNDAVQLSRITSGSGNRLFLDAANGLYQIGDIDGFNNHTFLNIDDTAQRLDFRSGTVPVAFGLTVDNSGGSYQLGDLTPVANGSEINIQDTTQQFSFNSNVTQDPYLLIDVINGFYFLGDLNVTKNGTLLEVNDFARQFIIQDGLSNLFLNINIGTGLYELGDINNTVNGTTFSVNDTTQLAQITDGSGNPFLFINIAGQDYALGDFNGVGNSTLFEADDLNQQAHIIGNLRVDAGTSGSTEFFRLDKATGTARLQAATKVEIISAGGLVIGLDTTMIHTTTSWANGAGVGIGTLTNAPAGGNPTKWIPVDDNGTTRFIPAW